MERVLRSMPDPGVADVVLVSCYELGHEPLGVTVPAGVLSRAGISVRAIDVALGDFDPDAVAQARLVAISTPMHTAMRLGARVAARVRVINPSAHLCFYGLYAGLNEHRLVPVLADSALGAECEGALLELARAVIAAPRPRAVAAAAAAPAPRPRDLDLSPRRDVLAGRERYVRLASGAELREVGYVQATRGCKHLCRHCPLPAAYDGRFYAIPVERVIEDVGALVARGARHLTFADADFLNGPTHALRVAREIQRRFPGTTFDYTAKIEHLNRHPRVVAELRDLGCLFVVTAVESFNDDVLRHLAKGHTREDALGVIRFFRDIGLVLRPSLVPFTPWETRKSLGELFDIVESEQLVDHIDPVQYSIRLLVPEGSLLLDYEPLTRHLTGYDAAGFSHAWRHPDEEMDRLQAAIAALAAHGTRGEEGFQRIRSLVQPDRTLRPQPAHRGPVPRLTEDWFC